MTLIQRKGAPWEFLQQSTPLAAYLRDSYAAVTNAAAASNSILPLKFFFSIPGSITDHVLYH